MSSSSELSGPVCRPRRQHRCDTEKVWTSWAPQAPRTIDSNLVAVKGANGTINMRAAGQSVGTLAELQRELKELPRSRSVFIRRMTFSDAVAFFAGEPGYPTQFMKENRTTPPLRFLTKDWMFLWSGWHAADPSTSCAMLMVDRWLRSPRMRRPSPTGTEHCSACNTEASGATPPIPKCA